MRTRTLVLPAVVALVPHARAGPVLATNNGVVLKIGERIEVLRDDGLPTRVIFDKVPDNLRARPTPFRLRIPPQRHGYGAVPDRADGGSAHARLS